MEYIFPLADLSFGWDMSVSAGVFTGDVNLFPVRYDRWVDLGGEFFAATDDDDDAGVASKPAAIATNEACPSRQNSPPKCI